MNVKRQKMQMLQDYEKKPYRLMNLDSHLLMLLTHVEELKVHLSMLFTCLLLWSIIKMFHFCRSGRHIARLTIQMLTSLSSMMIPSTMGTIEFVMISVRSSTITMPNTRRSTTTTTKASSPAVASMTTASTTTIPILCHRVSHIIVCKG